jgi:hypothetical protein
MPRKPTKPTKPGKPTKPKALTSKWPSAAIQHCLDCGKEPEIYVVTPRVWRDAGLGLDDACCKEDLSKRLGRPLRHADFLHVDHLLEQTPYRDYRLNELVDKYRYFGGGD